MARRRGGAAGVREQRGAPRPRPHRSAPDPLAQPEEGSVRGRVARAPQAARGRQGPRDRGLQLQAGPPRPAARGDRRGAAREPGAARPDDPSGGRTELPRRARHRDRELVADRRGRRPARRRDDRRRRASARQDAGADRAPVARPARARPDPQDLEAGAAGREHRRVRLRAQSGRDGQDSPRSIATAREPWTPTASATDRRHGSGVRAECSRYDSFHASFGLERDPELRARGDPRLALSRDGSEGRPVPSLRPTRAGASGTGGSSSPVRRSGRPRRTTSSPNRRRRTMRRRASRRGGGGVRGPRQGLRGRAGGVRLPRDRRRSNGFDRRRAA